jgi:hypothetical protein
MARPVPAIEVSVNTDRFVRQLEAIARHASALAAELASIPETPGFVPLISDAPAEEGPGDV